MRLPRIPALPVAGQFAETSAHLSSRDSGVPLFGPANRPAVALATPAVQRLVLVSCHLYQIVPLIKRCTYHQLMIVKGNEKNEFFLFFFLPSHSIG